MRTLAVRMRLNMAGGTLESCQAGPPAPAGGAVEIAARTASTHADELHASCAYCGENASERPGTSQLEGHVK